MDTNLRNLVAGSLVLLCICAGPASAAPVLTLACSGLFNPCIDQNLVSGSTVVGQPVAGSTPAAFHYLEGGGSREVKGAFDGANFDLFGSIVGGFDGGFVPASSFGLLVFDDLTITTTVPGAPASVTSSLNLRVRGSMDAAATSPTNGGIGTARFTMRTFVSSFQGDFENLGEYGIQVAGSDAPTTTVSGLGQQIAGGGFDPTFDALITTDDFIVPVNSAFSLTVQFSAESAGGGGTVFNPGAFAAFADVSGGFDLVSPIFNLPDGYTADSESGLIVDNRVPGSSSVPAPPSAGLLALGLLGAGCARRRRAL